MMSNLVAVFCLIVAVFFVGAGTIPFLVSPSDNYPLNMLGGVLFIAIGWFFLWLALL